MSTDMTPLPAEPHPFFDSTSSSKELAQFVLRSTNNAGVATFMTPLGESGKMLQRMRMQITRLRKKIKTVRPDQVLARFSLHTTIKVDTANNMDIVCISRQRTENQGLLEDLEKCGVLS